MKYAHVGIDDQAKALAGHPALHMRCSLDGVGFQTCVSSWHEDKPQKRQKPLPEQGFLSLVATACRTVAEWRRRESDPRAVSA